MNEIKIGDKVQTGVFVCGKFVPTTLGIVTEMLSGCCRVDIGSLHGCQPWILVEATSHLQLVK